MPNDQPPASSIQIQSLLDRLRAGETNARDELLQCSIARLRQLAKKIFSDIPGVRRWEETDDLLQNATVRLWRALQSHNPQTVRDYFRLAAAIIRRELIDLSRHHFGALGLGANMAHSHDAGNSEYLSPVDGKVDDTFDPTRLAEWAEFHEYVEQLPDDDRALFDVLWYQGQTLIAAAEILEIPERTLRRRWKSARLTLYRDLIGGPEDEPQ